MVELERVILPGYNESLKIHNEILFPNFCNELLKIKDLKLRPDDTFVIGYPKSGTTWTEEIVWLIQNDLDFEKCSRQFHFERVPFLEKEPLNKIDLLPAPRVFKSHLTLDYLPDKIEQFCKIIYVMRNPKDMLVSYFNFMKSIKGIDYNGTLENIIEDFSQDKIVYGNWCDHVNQFYSNSNILFITYEDLLEKSFEIVKKIVEFLGKSYTDKEIERLIEVTSFKNMKSTSTQLSRFHSDETFKRIDFSLFFRKGEIGNWVSHFNDQMSSKVDDLIKHKINPNIEIRYLPSK
ncbi:unnamed protein product [Brachionus calyciflorus]|uniref:Sulfotransferase domain-containing protein n=1 Tax=Brachionus calyciflorus TaxID=104777 RepID=A0A813YL22_9BILA|nr:unnamed protein product [Brachionus calyciflorus]